MNILKWPFLGRLLTSRYFLPTLQVIGLFIMVYAIWCGIIYTDEKTNPFTTALFWDLYWPFFMILTLVTFGKVFCSICPMGAIGIWLKPYTLGLELPAGFLKNPWFSLVFNLIIYWFVIYTFPGFLRVPFSTAIYFATFLFLAIGSALIFKNISWCKYLCPIAVPTNIFSKVAFMELRTEKDRCNSCKLATCIVGREGYKGCPITIHPGKLETNSECILCLKCVNACQHDAVTLRFRKPGGELFQPYKRPIFAHAMGVLLLLGAMPITMRFHYGIGHSPLKEASPFYKLGIVIYPYLPFTTDEGLIGFVTYIGSLALSVGLFSLATLLSSRWAKRPFKEEFTTFAFAMLPMLTIGSLTHILQFFFHEYFHSIVNGFSWAFSLGFSIEPLADRRAVWLSIFKVFPYIGAIWSLYLVVSYARREKRGVTSTLPFIMFIILNVALVLFVGYAQGLPRGHHHTSGSASPSSLAL